MTKNTVNKMRNVTSKRVNVKRPAEKKRFFFSRFFNTLKIVVILSLTTIVIGLTGYFSVITANKFLERPITAVVINGDFEYLTKDAIKVLIDEHVGNSFIKGNLSAIRQKLLTDPWIDNVELRREWPDVLHVSIKEQRAIARWGEKGFVNYRGDLVLSKNDSALNNLPLLRSDDSQAELVMRQYQFVSELINKYGLTVLMLEKNSIGIWTAELNNGWKLFLGRVDINKKIQRVLLALDQKAILIWSEIDSIDLRYENGLSVKWINADDELRNETVSVGETKKIHAKNI